jgi:hypothetical protein
MCGAHQSAQQDEVEAWQNAWEKIDQAHQRALKEECTRQEQEREARARDKAMRALRETQRRLASQRLLALRAEAREQKELARKERQRARTERRIADRVEILTSQRYRHATEYTFGC